MCDSPAAELLNETRRQSSYGEILVLPWVASYRAARLIQSRWESTSRSLFVFWRLFVSGGVSAIVPPPQNDVLRGYGLNPGFAVATGDGALSSQRARLSDGPDRNCRETTSNQSGRHSSRGGRGPTREGRTLTGPVVADDDLCTSTLSKSKKVRAILSLSAHLAARIRPLRQEPEGADRWSMKDRSRRRFKPAITQP